MIATEAATVNDESRSARRSSACRRDFRVLWGLGCALFVAVVGAQQSPDRTRPPVLGPAPKLTLPSIQKQTLSNGLPVWVVEAHEVPLAQISLVVRAGSGDDPPDRFGIGSLTAAMLDEGAGARSSLEIADAIEFLGATLTTASSFDASVIRLNVPVARLSEAVAIMADVALRPTFPQADLERLRQERLTSLLQARDDPGSIAAIAFARLVFGGTHRYGTGAIGTEASLLAAHADLRDFHATHFAPSGAVLMVVGDVRAGSILPLLEQHFGAWGAGAPACASAAGRAAQDRTGGARRQAGRGAVSDPDRLGGCGALHAGLLSDPGDERGFRRLVHVAA